jgi:GNAT superfamily N-acetyltransferase
MNDEDLVFVPAVGQPGWDALTKLRAVTQETMRATGLYSEEQLARGMTELRRRFERRTMWLATCGDGVVGAIGLDGRDDRLWDDDEPALYLYKVMAVPGLGVGPRLAGFAELQARRRGLPLLRLDCLRGNAPLHAWWKSQGFRHLRDVEFPGYSAGALFEKETG